MANFTNIGTLYRKVTFGAGILLNGICTIVVRVALAMQRLAQHAILHSTAQHPCALQHNATTGIIHIPSIVLAALGGQYWL